MAVGAGSRGLTRHVELLRGTVEGLRAVGAEPFVVPAMGSHGGGTAEGQLATLAGLGITEAGIDAEIRSTMDTEVVATVDDEALGTVELHLDRHAAAADLVLPVNRVKPHTSFHGPIESGLAKMAVVGFGKRAGAAAFHATGPSRLSRRLQVSIDALRATGRLLGGVGSVEAAGADATVVVAVEALTAAEVGGPAETALLDRARALLPGLPFAAIDVLIIEEGGKDVSGTTMDPNVTGRFWIDGVADADRPRVATIVLLGLTAATAGNATGIGFADVVPASLAAQVDWEADVPQLPHRRPVGRTPGPAAHGPARRGSLRTGGPCRLRPGPGRAEAGGAHRVDRPRHPVLGERGPAGRAAAGARIVGASGDS